MRYAARCGREDVDLVVLDMMLPGRSGLEGLAMVYSAKPALPVIVLTARGDIEHRIAGLDAGAVDYLVKPFSLGELAARILDSHPALRRRLSAAWRHTAGPSVLRDELEQATRGRAFSALLAWRPRSF